MFGPPRHHSERLENQGSELQKNGLTLQILAKSTCITDAFQSARGGRDRSQSEYTPRFEERESFGSGTRGGLNDTGTSRHLWVGIISRHVTENALAEQFSRFGELESIAMYPERNYAFVNFRREEDAALALRGLQGFLIGNLAMKIEFAKGAKPSRCLYVTGICPSVSAEELEAKFCRFGNLEAFKLDQERGMAFVDFERTDAAVAAIASLNRRRIGRQELRIDFVKPQSEKQERSLSSFSRGDEYLPNRMEHHSSEMRDLSLRNPSMLGNRSGPPSDKYRGDKSEDPSEVLWIGFPSHFNIDEMILRRAFSPYGEIEKVTTFPGRSYAFVQYRSIAAACRAKEDLHGKLFNDPRVHICFAKSEIGPIEHAKKSTSAPLPPANKSFGNSGPSGRLIENPHHDRNFWPSSNGDFRTPSPRVSSFEKIRPVGSASSAGFAFEQNRLRRFESDKGKAEDAYEPPDRRPQSNSRFEDSWDLPDVDVLFRETKKPRAGSLLHEKELPEYPFTDIGPKKMQFGPRQYFPALSGHEGFDKKLELGYFGTKHGEGHSENMNRPSLERDEHWRNHDNFEARSSPMTLKPVQHDQLTPDAHQSPLDEAWKWNGTIAKGGTPVCRARCFPVGRALDVMLPEFLNCTARTGLDMLAKHFYQAASVGVVFFVPESDGDIMLYNEFMHYLGERERAAVAKLGEKTTLFLVPPSDFSEKVLKVPGKMSISGVILKFDHTSSNFGPQDALEAMNSKLLPFVHGDGLAIGEDTSYHRPRSPEALASYMGRNKSNLYTEPQHSSSSFPSLHMPEGLSGSYNPGHAPGSFSLSTKRTFENFSEDRYDPLPHQSHTQLSSWSSRQMQNSSPRNINEEHLQQPAVVDGNTSSSHYIPATPSTSLAGSNAMSQQEMKLPQPSSTSTLPLQPGQIAQLASLLAQQNPSGHLPNISTQDNRSPKDSFKLSEEKKPSGLQTYGYASSQSLDSQFGNLKQQAPKAPLLSNTETQNQSSDPQSQSTDKEDMDGDPQKRLQATLQLAAALLQQIQQQAKGA
ncbi:hypothetical protein AMTRI_Chr10g233210 [Amborella trichopoda]